MCCGYVAQYSKALLTRAISRSEGNGRVRELFEMPALSRPRILLAGGVLTQTHVLIVRTGNRHSGLLHRGQGLRLAPPQPPGTRAPGGLGLRVRCTSIRSARGPAKRARASPFLPKLYTYISKAPRSGAAEGAPRVCAQATWGRGRAGGSWVCADEPDVAQRKSGRSSQPHHIAATACLWSCSNFDPST